MRSLSPGIEQNTRARSPLEFHSDAMSADVMPIDASQTPLKNVRALGEMEVFIASSPTPQARNRSQERGSDRTSMATPTGIRSVQSHHPIDELGSSPPRFEKANVNGSHAREDTEDSHCDVEEHDQYGASAISFDDGTTIDEDALLIGTPDEDPDQPDEETTAEIDASDMPSSNLDLQLTAQLDAEIQAQKLATASKTPIEQHSRQERSTAINQAMTDSMHSNAETTSTSRVGDSFSSPTAESESSQVRSLRRSQRKSSASSPQSSNAKKRKASSGRGPGRPRKGKIEADNSDATAIAPQTEIIGSSISVTSPAPAENTVVPDTTRAQSARRSASLLSRGENQPEDVVVEDTPAPKRARRSIDQDVSEAKHGTPTTSQQSMSKRLSHVRVTPRHAESLPSGRDSFGEVEQNGNVAPQLPHGASTPGQVPDSQPQVASNSVATPSRSFVDRVQLTPRSIINKLKAFKDALFGAPQLALNRQEHREVDDLMFDIRMAVYDAGKRGEPGQ